VLAPLTIDQLQGLSALHLPRGEALLAEGSHPRFLPSNRAHVINSLSPKGISNPCQDARPGSWKEPLSMDAGQFR